MVLLGARVQHPELDVVAQVAVIDVRRIVRIERLGGLGPGVGVQGCRRAVAWCRRRSSVADVGIARRGRARRVGRHVHHHGRVADRPGAEEELLVLALRAVPHRADAEAVGEHLGADAADAVVDGEGVAARCAGCTRACRVVELGERLHGADLVVVDDGELAERLLAVRVGVGVRREGRAREAAAVLALAPAMIAVRSRVDDLGAV